jgi:hypothetical protein
VERLAALYPGQRTDHRDRLGLGAALNPIGPELGDGIVVLLVEEDDALDHPGERGLCW